MQPSYQQTTPWPETPGLFEQLRDSSQQVHKTIKFSWCFLTASHAGLANEIQEYTIIAIEVVGGFDMTSSNHTQLEQSAPLNMDGEFFLTELAEQPGSKILYRLGTVQANARHAPNDDDLAARQKMNQAVRTIITEAW